MPPGGDGVYYFSTYLLMDESDYDFSTVFDIQLNDDEICNTASHDYISDFAPGFCSVVVNVVPGKWTFPQFVANGMKTEFI